MAAERLDIYYGTTLIGSLFDTDPLSFQYTDRWLGNPRKTGCMISGYPVRGWQKG